MGAVVDPNVVFDAFPGNVINNDLVPTKKTTHSLNPSTGKPLWPAPSASEADVNAAVRSARAAFPSWSQTPWAERARLVRAFADEIERHLPELTQLNAVESGKAVALAGFETHSAAKALRGHAGLEVRDDVLEDTDERTIYGTHVALGVVAAIVPWNFPVVLSAVKIGPALMTGNCLVLKPSPLAPYTALKIGELASRVLPPGVLQVLNGDADLGRWLTEHDGIDMVSFTGSSATGKLVAKSCAGTLKRVLLELGGNDAAVVCEDAFLPAVVPKIAMTSFLHAGQICMAIKRIYVHEKIYDQFRDALVKFVKENVKAGGIFEENVVVGPVQNKTQYDFVKGLFDDVHKQGLKSALEGGPRENKEGGYFFNPSIIDNPPEDSRVVVEEAFGPIVPLLKWSSEDEVVAQANGLRTGLSASVWSSDLDRAERLARRIEAGTVWINTHFQSEPHIPSSGFKESGIGIEGGLEGFKSYMNHRTVWVPKKKA